MEKDESDSGAALVTPSNGGARMYARPKLPKSWVNIGHSRSQRLYCPARCSLAQIYHALRYACVGHSLLRSSPVDEHDSLCSEWASKVRGTRVLEGRHGSHGNWEQAAETRFEDERC